jgi:NTP pyrophosphatase (non-canonical NTP hydrolase)
MKELGYEIHKIAADRGWTIPQSFTETDAIARKLCLIHSEVSEALEAVRVNDKGNFGEELADIIIRTLHLAHGLNIDIDNEVSHKIEVNRTRPYMHGGKRF